MADYGCTLVTMVVRPNQMLSETIKLYRFIFNSDPILLSLAYLSIALIFVFTPHLHFKGSRTFSRSPKVHTTASFHALTAEPAQPISGVPEVTRQSPKKRTGKRSTQKRLLLPCGRLWKIYQFQEAQKKCMPISVMVQNTNQFQK